MPLKRALAPSGGYAVKTNKGYDMKRSNYPIKGTVRTNDIELPNEVTTDKDRKRKKRALYAGR